MMGKRMDFSWIGIVLQLLLIVDCLLKWPVVNFQCQYCQSGQCGDQWPRVKHGQQ
jgi:hypothetical protein